MTVAWRAKMKSKPISKAERKKLDRFHEQRKAKLRKKYPEIHGKKLDYVTHSFEDTDGGGWLYINLYLTDGMNFSMDFSMNNTAIVPRCIHYGDISKEDNENIRTYYYRGEKR